MYFSFDSIFFLLFGTLSIVFAISRKRILLWTTTEYGGTKKWLGSKYVKITNLVFGIVGIAVGIYLLLN